MQFKVPQFLDIEDKLFGPFTFSEFVYLAGGAGLCYVVYKALGLLLGLIPIAAIAGLAVALVFYKPNDKPLVNMIEAGIKYAAQSKLYIWKRRVVKSTTKTPAPSHRNPQTINVSPEHTIKLTGSKLRDLAWSLDILDTKKEGTNGN
ncbi:MAG: PrgI family protein [Candidatus Pacebacteria bacterium]|nr:PrgI family protein [Candidatus Paceibacterota bacterium]MBP9851106.1 PrgI family protein [Candidatus Paceibacterota bacterium]